MIIYGRKTMKNYTNRTKRKKNFQEREKDIVCFFEDRIAIMLLVTGSYEYIKGGFLQ